jgi:hypothetical protein
LVTVQKFNNNIILNCTGGSTGVALLEIFDVD